MASTPNARIAVGGGSAAQQNRLLIFLLFVLFIIFYSMLTPYPPPSLLILTPTTGRLMIASRVRRRFWSRGGRWMCWQRRWRRTLGWTCRWAFVSKNMRNRAHAEALAIFYSARKLRGSSREGRRWWGMHWLQQRRIFLLILMAVINVNWPLW